MKIHTVFVLSDIHVPHHNQKLWRTMVKCVNGAKNATCVILGDLMDFGQISRFGKDPGYPMNVGEELDLAAKMLKQIKCPLIFMEGNHCARLKKAVGMHAPEMVGVRGLSVYSQLVMRGLTGMREVVESLTNEGLFLANKQLLLMHGDKAYPMAPLNQARKMLTDFPTVSLLVGHSHNAATAYHTSMGKTRVAAVNPCFQNKAGYKPHASWQQGFSVVTLWGGTSIYNSPHFSVKQIIADRDGMFEFNGKVYK